MSIRIGPTSRTKSCTVTGKVRLGAGVARFVPFPLTWTRALPLEPALSFAAMMPAGVAARLW